MRKVAGKKRDMENGDKVDAVESDAEEMNGVEEDADPLATTVENGDNDAAEEQDANNDASDAEADADEKDDDDDEDKPLKSSSKKASKKKEKKAAKKAAKKSKKKEKKRVSLNVPADKVDPEDEDDDDEEEEEEYEVQSIVDHRYVGKKLEYKIRWKGYSAKDDTWEAKASLSCPDIIKKYEASQKSNSKASTSGNKKRKGGKSPAKPTKKARKEESEDEDDDDEDDDKEYEVARLLDVRTRKGKREFLVHWKGWSARFDNWEPEENLNCDDLISKFDEKLDKAKSATQKELRAVPKTTKRFAVDPKHKGARSSKRGGGRTRVTYYDDE